MYDMYVHMCVLHVHILVVTCERAEQRMVLCVFLCHSPPCLLRESLTASGSRLQSVNPRNAPASVSPRAGIRDVHGFT